MISISRCPYRISLLGGGSDLDWFIEKHDYGVSCGFSTNIYSHVIINKLRNESNKGILNYSAKETYKSLDEIAHPLIREVFKFIKPDEFLELSSFGFASGGSGLGGSSSFLIALLSSLKLVYPEKFRSRSLAELACYIEIEILKKPIGRQDQYIASKGGISSFCYKKNGIVTEHNLNNYQIKALEKSIKTLYLIPTGIKRKADNVLNQLKENSNSFDEFLTIRKLAEEFLNSSLNNSSDLFNILNHSIKQSWSIKKNMFGIMNEDLERKMNIISECPHHWIRLLGAGAGGYFLLSSRLSSIETQSFLNKKNIMDWVIPLVDEEGVKSIQF